MPGYLTFILLCQLAGELVIKGLGTPIPGLLVGMILLFLFSVLRRSPTEGLSKIGDALLGNLSLLFVPAGVGVLLHYKLF